MELQRDEIYYITFPYTLDERYPNGQAQIRVGFARGGLFQAVQYG